MDEKPSSIDKISIPDPPIRFLIYKANPWNYL